MLFLFFATLALETLLSLGLGWKIKRTWAGCTAILVAFSSAGLLFGSPNVFTAIIFSLGLYRLINLLRVVDNRQQNNRLAASYRRAFAALAMVQILLFLAQAVFERSVEHVSYSEVWVILTAAQLLAALTILLITLRNIAETRFRPALRFYSDSQLPTVSVAIPARNETVNLTDCIDAVLANDYPKLEVLVLDDCSQDNTSDIIRGYAQAGVRFLHGAEPKKDWLAKNQAYAQLAEAANGEFIIFCGVDTRLQAHTIRSVVAMAMEREKDMISILPRRSALGLSASLIQPLRYWWELALPRKLFNRPPVLSSFWMIRRHELLKYGGFKAISRSVLPEAYFAKRLIQGNRYSFVRSGPDSSVMTYKGFYDQFERALRLRYPEVHHRLELVWSLSLLETVFLLSPFVVTIGALLRGNVPLLLLSLLSCILLMTAHGLITVVSTTRTSVSSLLNFPITVAIEIGVANLSMLRYEFSDVTWKERNICIPVMHARQRPVKVPERAVIG